MNTYEKNIELLKLQNPELVKKLTEITTDGVDPLKTEDGYSYIVDGPDGQKIGAGDPQNAVASAKAFYKLANVGQRRSIFCLGVGSGHLPKVAWDNTVPGEAITIIETHLALLKAVLEHVDYTKELSSGRLTILGHLDPDRITDWGHILFELAINGYIFIPDSSSYHLDGKYYSTLIDRIDEEVNYETMSGRTSWMFSNVYVRHILHNAIRYHLAPGINEWKGAFTGKTAYVIGTGPSLERNYEALKEAKERGILIACDTAYKPLIKNGVTPDITCCLDFHDGNERCFEGADHPKDPGLLVCNPKITPKVFDNWPGRTAFYFEPTYTSSWVSEKGKTKKGNIRHSTCVGHMAFLLAEYMGFSEIILVGQDMAWTDDKMYASQNPFEEEDEQEAAETGKTADEVQAKREQLQRVNPPKIKGYEGELSTSPQLASYCARLNRYIAASLSYVVDTATRAAKKPVDQVIELAEYVAEQSAPQGGDADHILAGRHDLYKPIGTATIEKELVQLCERLRFYAVASLRCYQGQLDGVRQYEQNAMAKPAEDFGLIWIVSETAKILDQIGVDVYEMCGEFSMASRIGAHLRSKEVKIDKLRGGPVNTLDHFEADLHAYREMGVAAEALWQIMIKVTKGLRKPAAPGPAPDVPAGGKLAVELV